MHSEEFRIPQIENQAPALNGQSYRHRQIYRRVEMSKALRHDDGKVVSVRLGLIVADICLNVFRTSWPVRVLSQ